MINFSSKLRFSSIKLIQHILRANNKIILNKDAELKKKFNNFCSKIPTA